MYVSAFVIHDSFSSAADKTLNEIGGFVGVGGVVDISFLNVIAPCHENLLYDLKAEHTGF